MEYRLLACVKDEGPFILEWIAHHQAVGFNRIMIAYNDCTDGTAELLVALANAGVIDIFENIVPEHIPPQKSAYDKIIGLDFVKDADWLAILDADEFLNIHIGDGSVQALCAKFSDVDFIALNWMVFGDNGHENWKDELVTERFTSAITGRRGVNTAIKTLTRSPKRCTRLTNHHTRFCDMAQINFVNGGGKLLHFGESYGFNLPRKLNSLPGKLIDHSLGQINHYATKTFDSFCVRVARGGGFSKAESRHTTQYYAKRNFQEMEQEASISQYSHVMKANLKKLKALPKISEISQQIVTEYGRRVALVHKKIDEGVFDTAQFVNFFDNVK